MELLAKSVTSWHSQVNIAIGSYALHACFITIFTLLPKAYISLSVKMVMKQATLNQITKGSNTSSAQTNKMKETKLQTMIDMLEEI